MSTHVASTPIATPRTEDGPVVATTTGAVRGTWRDITSAGPTCPYQRSAAFYGIPYAEDPVGEHRFTAPAPRSPWQGERDATSPGPTPQRRPFGEATAIPEPSVPGDGILNLNVFTPVPGDDSAALPVYVWIHGGGFYAGSHNSPYYDGAAFNRDGVVTVSVAYRLGLDGFGWIPDSDAPVNRGLLDQLLALEWVQKNIFAFGGDPERVTIGGQSAGGASVMAHLVSPRSQGLFQGVICESGGTTAATVADARRVTTRGAEIAGIEPTLAGWRSLTEEQVLDVSGELATEFPLLDVSLGEDGLARYLRLPEAMSRTFSPVVDGDLVPEPTLVAVAHGVGADTPLLAGGVRHEMAMLGLYLQDEVGDAGIDALLTTAGAGPELITLFHAEHPELECKDALAVGQIVSDALFRLPLLEWSRLRAADARAATRTWLWDFSWGSTCEGPGEGLAGHCQEVPFAFDCLDHPHADGVQGSGRPQPLADLVHADWVRFITTGEAPWAPYGDPASPGTGRLYGAPEERGGTPDGAVDVRLYGFENAVLAADRARRSPRG